MGDGELQRLREVESRLTSITKHAPDFIIEFDRDGVISYMNRPAPGHSLDQMVGSNVRAWMEPEAHVDFERCIARVFETGELSSYESVGSVTGRFYVNRVSPVLSGDRVVSAILITHDITDIRVAQQRLQDVERRYRALVEASFEGLALSVDRVLIFGNEALADMFGYSVDELAGMSPAQMATPESVELVAKNVAAGIETPYEVTCVRKDGSTFPVELLGRNTMYQGQPARITGFRDLTERRRQESEQARREERVRQAQKLETLGVLAGGIAHDFNNLLAVMLANIDLALNRRADPERAAGNMGEARTAVLRAQELTSQLLVYAGRGEQSAESVDVNGLLREATELLRVSIDKQVTLRFELTDEIPAIDADVGQLRQIVMNLILNASESLPDGGEIVVETGSMQVDDGYLDDSFGDAGLDAGDYVYFAVRDTGVGMDAATVRRIFDPFFTTKFAGRGLGLATVQGIVRAHRGAIKVESAPGQGTCFRVLFPSAARQPEAAAVPAAVERERHRGGTILLAEDEPLLARAVRDALESEGYQVLLAEDGDRAASLFAEQAGAIDIALLDVTMPGKTGLEVLREIRAAAPALPVILSSGYSYRRHEELIATDQRLHVLNKPYGVDALLDLLADCLGGDC